MEPHRLYYNFIKPHMGLDGKTPSEVVGIKLNIEKNKWIDLLKKLI